MITAKMSPISQGGVFFFGFFTFARSSSGIIVPDRSRFSDLYDADR